MILGLSEGRAPILRFPEMSAGRTARQSHGVASNVTRHSIVNGFQGDSAFRVSPDHTLRAGFTASL
jgi:hypothetical protein